MVFFFSKKWSSFNLAKLPLLYFPMKRGWSDQVVAVEVKSNLKFVLAFRATAEKRRNVEVKS